MGGRPTGTGGSAVNSAAPREMQDACSPWKLQSGGVQTGRSGPPLRCKLSCMRDALRWTLPSCVLACARPFSRPGMQRHSSNGCAGPHLGPPDWSQHARTRGSRLWGCRGPPTVEGVGRGRRQPGCSAWGAWLWQGWGSAGCGRAGQAWGCASACAVLGGLCCLAGGRGWPGEGPGCRSGP